MNGRRNIFTTESHGSIVVIVAELVGPFGTWSTCRVDVSMSGLGVDRLITRLGVTWPGVRECYPAILPHVRIWHCDLW